MSALLDDRAKILAALEASGVQTSTTGGSFAAPCVIVLPGDPWSEPDRLPGRRSRWRLEAIAGRVDSGGSLELLADLVDAVDAALRPVAGLQLPTWSRPTDELRAGVSYALTIATVQMIGAQ